jgi:hypothetical protein
VSDKAKVNTPTLIVPAALATWLPMLADMTSAVSNIVFFIVCPFMFFCFNCALFHLMCPFWGLHLFKNTQSPNGRQPLFLLFLFMFLVVLPDAHPAFGASLASLLQDRKGSVNHFFWCFLTVSMQLKMGSTTDGR